MKIDVHSHIIPENIIHEILLRGDRFGASIQTRNSQPWIVHQQGYQYPLLSQFYDPLQKQRDMTVMGLDFTVLTPAPPMFMYWIEPTQGAAFARQVNRGASEFVQAQPQQFLSFATIPMQDPRTACKELEYAATLPGLCGVEVGTSIEGKPLHDPAFADFFSLCEQLDWPIFLHPYYVGDKGGMKEFYFTNLIGNPLDTAVGAASLIFGGVLDKHPHLRILLAHGGGFFPYQIGRLDHGYEVRNESHTCAAKPSTYLERFFYDTITFHAQALTFLLDIAGADRIVLGTDYPFDMGESNPLGMLNKAVQGDARRLQQVTYENVLAFLGRTSL